MSNEAKTKKQPDPFDEDGLRKFVREALEGGYYRESYHSEVERASRNISIHDIAAGLERDDWRLGGAPEYDEKHGEWKYTIRTVDLEGEELHV